MVSHQHVRHLLQSVNTLSSHFTVPVISDEQALKTAMTGKCEQVVNEADALQASVNLVLRLFGNEKIINTPSVCLMSVHGFFSSVNVSSTESHPYKYRIQPGEPYLLS